MKEVTFSGTATAGAAKDPTLLVFLMLRSIRASALVPRFLSLADMATEGNSASSWTVLDEKTLLQWLWLPLLFDLLPLPLPPCVLT